MHLPFLHSLNSTRSTLVSGLRKLAHLDDLVNIISSSTNSNTHVGITDDAVLTVLNARIHADLFNSFGNSKTLMNANASCHGRWLKLHFKEHGRIKNAKVLAFALDESHLGRPFHEERMFHIYYQFLADTMPQERDHSAHIPATVQCLCRRGITGFLAVGHLAAMP